VRLHAFRVGKGERGAVLLHGFLGSGRNLRTLARRWSEADPSLCILVPDLTGHGESPPLPERPTLEGVAADVEETLEAAGLGGPVLWVGHSLGGRVALAAARRHAADMRGVDLLDIGPGKVPAAEADSGQVVDALCAAPERAGSRREMRDWLCSRLPPALADWLAMNLVPSEGALRQAQGSALRLAQGSGFAWRVDREALRRAHPAMLSEDLWDVVLGRRVPIRCARGGESPYVPGADARRLEANGCPVTTFLGAGHFLHVDALEPLVAWLAGPR